MGSDADAAAYWDQHADMFDEQPDHGLRDAGVRAAWSSLLLPLLPAPPATIADLGCGTGSLGVLFASAGHAVTGLDISPRMVAAAQGKAAAAHLAVTFEVGDAADPALPQGAFDVVFARHVLWALAEPATALRRWVRLLRPEGRLLLVEGRWHTGAGISATEAARLVRLYRTDATITLIRDPVLWGGPISDERYVLVSRR